MKKLQTYMLKSFLGPFVFTFFIALFILLLQFLWKYIDDLVGKGLEWHIIARLLFYASSTFVPLALPLAILLSSLMTFGNLGENYELVSIKAAGISLRKAMKPLAILAVFISIAAFLFSNYVLPVANLKFGSLLYDVRQQKLAFNINEGIFYNGLDNVVIQVGRKDKDNKTIYDVKIYDHTQRMGNTQITLAKKGVMELSPDKQRLVFTLYDGNSYSEINERAYRKNRPFQSTGFEKQILVFDLGDFQLNRTNEDLFRSHYSMLNIQQLNHSIDSLSENKVERVEFYKKKYLKRYSYIDKLDSTLMDTVVVKDSVLQAGLKYPLINNFDHSKATEILATTLKTVRTLKENVIYYKKEVDNRELILKKHEVVWHQKFKLSLACLIFFFIGAPLGAIIRKGGLGFPVVISVLFFVVYHVTSITGEKAALTGEWNVVFGVWLSTLVILPMGLFLTWKATTDAPLLDSESWGRFFARFGKILMIFKKK
ncbi:MAG: YjgP/YjgQ family permease [Chlorobi bacterium]|nr:YjgP/YjgQ family permease [Chlorobiota bacterium]